MSGAGVCEMLWGDGRHRFALPIAQLEELQAKCDCGPMVVLSRLESGSWRVADIRETIRLGLLGGGATPQEALLLVARYVDARPLTESIVPAIRIVAAALFGVKDDPVGEVSAGAQASSAPAETESSASPASTAQAP